LGGGGTGETGLLTGRFNDTSVSGAEGRGSGGTGETGLLTGRFNDTPVSGAESRGSGGSLLSR